MGKVLIFQLTLVRHELARLDLHALAVQVQGRVPPRWGDEGTGTSQFLRDLRGLVVGVMEKFLQSTSSSEGQGVCQMGKSVVGTGGRAEALPFVKKRVVGSRQSFGR